MIISQTPFRLSFFGGGTDFPEFYSEHGGAVLLTTIDKFCYITIHRLAPFFKHRFKASYALTESVQAPEEFRHPLIREGLLALGIRDGLEIVHVADLPGRTGLGSSSSFTVGFLNCLHAFRGENATPEQLAREAVEIERVRVGDPGGHQDQYAAACGGLLRIEFSRDRAVRVHPLPVPEDRREELRRHLLLFYTGTERSADEILTEQRNRIGQNIAALQEMRQMVDEAERILTGGALPDFGRLLHESWRRKRGLSPGISTGLVDESYAAARSAGALGGKLLGAGGHGFLLVFGEPGRHDAIRAKLTGLRELTFGFAKSGSRIIFKSPE